MKKLKLKLERIRNLSSTEAGQVGGASPGFTVACPQTLACPIIQTAACPTIVCPPTTLPPSTSRVTLACGGSIPSIG